MRFNISGIWAAAIIAALLLTQCGAGPVSSREELKTLSATEKALLNSGNDFGFDLLRKIVQAEPEKNTVVSPLSVSMALGMTYNGAAGTTITAMADVLGVGGLSTDSANAGYKRLMDLLLRLDPKVQMSVGNSIWYKKEYTFNPEFLSRVSDAFTARVSPLDFNNPASVDTINGWVKKQTKNRIPRIINDIGSEMVMFLINAIYFKGAWTYRFDPGATQNDEFQTPDGAVSVRMMNQTRSFDFYSNADAQIVDLPYGNGEFRMTVVLPAGDDGLNALIAGLNQSRWDAWIAGLSSSRLTFSMPRFTLNYDRLLNNDLKAMGMAVAFDPDAADFSDMMPPGEPFAGNLFISKVQHKTFIEVNEEGTEAAAATSVGIGIVSAPPAMRVDRPFLFAIRERLSGAILFMGAVTNPVADAE